MLQWIKHWLLNVHNVHLHSCTTAPQLHYSLQESFSHVNLTSLWDDHSTSSQMWLGVYAAFWAQRDHCPSETTLRTLYEHDEAWHRQHHLLWGDHSLQVAGLSTPEMRKLLQTRTVAGVKHRLAGKLAAKTGQPQPFQLYCKWLRSSLVCSLHLQGPPICDVASSPAKCAWKYWKDGCHTAAEKMSSWLARRPIATLSALPTWKSMGENAPWRNPTIISQSGPQG